jgi:hypothetical protein
MVGVEAVVSDDFGQPINTNLCIVNKAQHAPTNWWRFVIGSRYSSVFFKP